MFKNRKRLLAFIFVLIMFNMNIAVAKKDTKKNDKQTALMKELKRLKQLKMKLTLENAIQAEKFKKKLRELNEKQIKFSVKNKLLAAKNRKLMLEMQLKRQKQQNELMQVKMKISQLSFERAKSQFVLSKLRTELALRKNKKEWKSQVNKKIHYSMNPFVNGVLTISDRRISLNGPIISGVADYITKRIHYYNNKTTLYPIFIVIDKCPGGSVMEGYRIVKAMKASKAPVYVVVKSFAASMAAVITTLSKNSYAYPNAVILHHQMSTINWGNMTVLREQLKKAEEWEKRLMIPVAKKMGISVKEFIKKMYKNNSRGDWDEFADKAKRLKWVNNIVNEIKEISIIKKPSDNIPKRRYYFRLKSNEKKDNNGKRYVKLPRLTPFDYYFIYNPDRYYR